MINNWPEDEFVLLGNVKSSIDSSIHLIGFSDALQVSKLNLNKNQSHLIYLSTV